MKWRAKSFPISVIFPWVSSLVILPHFSAPRALILQLFVLFVAVTDFFGLNCNKKEKKPILPQFSQCNEIWLCKCCVSMCQLCPWEHRCRVCHSRDFPGQKGIVQIPAEAPKSSHIILHILGWNYWKFYINISNNGIFLPCGLQKTRRSLDLDKTTVLIVKDPANQQYIPWPLLCKESTKKYLCAEIKCFTNTVSV